MWNERSLAVDYRLGAERQRKVHGHRSGAGTRRFAAASIGVCDDAARARGRARRSALPLLARGAIRGANPGGSISRMGAGPRLLLWDSPPRGRTLPTAGPAGDS